MSIKYSNIIRRSGEKEFIADLIPLHNFSQISVRYKVTLGGINVTGSCNKCKLYPFICRMNDEDEYLCTYISKQMGDLSIKYLIDKIVPFVSLIYASKLRTDYVREIE